MSLVSAATTRFFSSALYLTRLAVHRLGLGPVVLAATAAAALVYSWRNRRAQQPRRVLRQQTQSQHSNTQSNTPQTHRRPASAERTSSWLARVRRVTIGARWTPHQSSNLFCNAPELDKRDDLNPQQQPSPAHTHALVVRPEIVPALKKFADLFDLYLIIEVDDDEAEGKITSALNRAGLFEPGLLDKRKLLFCETDLGKASIARQVESQLHVDESVAVINALQRFVPYVSLVTASAKSLAMPSASNVTKFTSLASFRF